MLEARMTYVAQRRLTVDKLNKEMKKKLIEVVCFFKSVWKLTPLNQILLKIVCPFVSTLQKQTFETNCKSPFTLNGCLPF